jgi:hypothetical protein
VLLPTQDAKDSEQVKIFPFGQSQIWQFSKFGDFMYEPFIIHQKKNQTIKLDLKRGKGKKLPSKLLFYP